MSELFVMILLVFLLVGVASAYGQSGFLGSLIWGPALGLILVTCCLYVLIVAGGVSAIKALFDTIGKVAV